MVDAGCMNPNQWMLNRRQLIEIISNKVDWLDKQVITRLISAYDPQNSGIIRYIRISVSLLCCVRPALTSLMSLFHRIQEKTNEKRQRALLRSQATANADSRISQSDDASVQSSIDGDKQSNDGVRNENELMLFLLRLIHGLYEDCEGGIKV